MYDEQTLTKLSAEYLMWHAVPEAAVARYRELQPQIQEIWTKEATWPRRYFELTQLLPASNPLPLGLPSKPSPMLSMLVGGMAGAGLGYGLGYLGEKALPQKWRRGNLSRSLALVGGGLGALPGALYGGINLAGGRSFNDGTTFGGIGYDPSQAMKAMEDYDAAQGSLVPLEKLSFIQPGATGAGYGFDPNEFNELIWKDPYLNPQLQAAASGLVAGAANLPGKSTNLVTPMDVARLAAGMGSGYLSGMLVGKALGVVMGMPDETQNKLRLTGGLAGLVANLVPIAFGG